MPAEFELIRRYFSDHQSDRLNQARQLRTGIGDDAAVLAIDAQQDWVTAIDTMVAGVHFPLDTDPYSLGHKALAVNLSDLAAMGATPHSFTLALTLPSADGAWVEAFSAGLFDLANQHGVLLLGGDTTSGPLTITVQVNGVSPSQQALLRSGASVGDDVYVSGQLGGAASALVRLKAGEICDRRRLDQPQPRITLGEKLRDLASAAIDVSDGLLADLKHILKASHCGATLQLELVPRDRVNGELVTLEQAVSGGDDYELCFTASPAAALELTQLASELQLPLTRIGHITSIPKLSCFFEGKPLYTDDQALGYQHFSKDDDESSK